MEQSAREIEDETGQQVIPMSLDVTNTDQVNQCIADATRQLGGLHILVNSASYPEGPQTLLALSRQSMRMPFP
ncbi:MAG: hypothetical protein Ct9H300mP27_11690 [Chloroflexota bacterium]|nr:MAG: hypothetical protein Ct9H300mP27_11690 [Chloroflexota bacterium]